jgi:hypothetical protein
LDIIEKRNEKINVKKNYIIKIFFHVYVILIYFLNANDNHLR